jgi:hypothetical protein
MIRILFYCFIENLLVELLLFESLPVHQETKVYPLSVLRLFGKCDHIAYKYFYYPKAKCLEENVYLHMISSITETDENLVLVTTFCCHMVKIECLRNITTPYIVKNRHKNCAKYTIVGLYHLSNVGTRCGKYEYKIESTRGASLRSINKK